MTNQNVEYNCLQLSLLVQKKQPNNTAYFIAKATEVSQISMLARKKVQEVLNFISRQTAINLEDKVVHGQWDENVTCLVHALKQGPLCIVAITGQNYPATTATRLMKTVINDVQVRLPPQWTSTSSDCQLISLEQEMKQFCKPTTSNIELLQAELDQTKQLVMDNMQQLIQRQNNLDDILKESEDLSAAAKDFVKNTKKLKRCAFCRIM